MNTEKRITPKGALSKSIKSKLLKFFQSKGFVQYKFSKEPINSELNARMPIGMLKKDLGDSIALVEVTFCAGRVPKFFIDIAKSPKHGIVLPHGQVVDVDDIHTSALPERYRLSASSFYKKTFTFGFFSNKSQPEADRVVDRAINLSAEILSWFYDDQKGPHLFRLESFVGNKVVKAQ